MANSTLTTQLTEIVSSQAQKEITANANFRAASPSMSFARNDITTAGLTWAYYGGTVDLDNTVTQVTAGSITNIPISRTNNIHIEIGRVSTTSTINITGITVAAAAVITVASHNFVTGDYGYISTAVATMLPIQGTFFRVTATTATTITTDIISTGFAAWTSGGTIAKVTQGSGTLVVGKAHVLHFPVCKPLYTLTTSTVAVTAWTDLRKPDLLSFNTSLSINGDRRTIVNGTEYSGKLVAWYEGLPFVGLGCGSANSTAADGGAIFAGRSRGTLAVPAIVQDGDTIRIDHAVAFDGVDFAMGGNTKFIVDGTPGANDMPTRYEVAISDDGSQTPTTRFTLKATGPIFNSDNINISNSKTPASSTDTGVAGQICWDTSYLYICTATNTWTRVLLAW